MLYIGRIQELVLAGNPSSVENAALRHGSTSSYESYGSAGPQSNPPARTGSRTTEGDDGMFCPRGKIGSLGTGTGRARRGCLRSASHRPCTSGAGRG